MTRKTNIMPGTKNGAGQSSRQWPTTVAVLLSASGGDISCISWLAKKGEERLESKDKRVIQGAKELGGLKLEWFLPHVNASGDS